MQKKGVEGVVKFFQNKKFPIFTVVARNENKFIGNFMWMPYSFIHLGRAIILEIAVDKNHQGKGIGTKLLKKGMQDIKEYFKKEGYKAKIIFVSTDDFDDKAISFYKKLGFEEIANFHPFLNHEILLAKKIK